MQEERVDLTDRGREVTLGGPGGDSADRAPGTTFVQLLEAAENMQYHHAARDRHHYRSAATVDLLWQLLALLARKEESDDDSTP